MMLTSREAVVNYMTPLGLAHIMATGHHYGPGPWVSDAGRARLDAVVLPSRRHARHRLRPHGDGQQRRGAVLPAGAAIASRAARRSPTRCCSGSTACAGRAAARRAARCGTSWCIATSAGVDSVRACGARGTRVRAVDRPARFARGGGLPARFRSGKRSGGAMRRCSYFQTFSRNADSGRLRAAGASARVLLPCDALIHADPVSSRRWDIA